MNVAGMMRLSEIDESKVGKDLMKYSIKWLSDKVDALYFLQIGNILLENSKLMVISFILLEEKIQILSQKKLKFG